MLSAAAVRKLKIALGVLVVVLLIFKFGLLTSRAVPEKSRFAIDLAALRTAAGPVESLPESARADRVASLMMPCFLAVTGGPLALCSLVQYGWQLIYPDGSSVILDPVHSRATQDKNSGDTYDDQAWERQEAAIAVARVIAVTHEHYDHLGGATDSKHFASFGDKLKLTAAQRKKAPLAGVERDLSGPATLDSGPEGSLHPIAPGVVAITAPGHTPGSQLIYLRLKGGAEFLLLGDLVWQNLNLELAVGRARLPSLIMSEDTEGTVNQLRAVLELKKANPTLDLVVAHDAAAMEARFKAGTVASGLIVPTPAPPAP